ncbi:uncharacterized protein A4U43_C10F8660 [Asparagus officinalis]|uniref:Uncharacterized protein n=1 Tax=Asparagus officinalis TaxID=4686 RepID=A0A5P1E1H6_ASPOF|nr:uncharacterized protein A4U43_C10F8660 [Asparagus officinalis]
MTSSTAGSSTSWYVFERRRRHPLTLRRRLRLRWRWWWGHPYPNSKTGVIVHELQEMITRKEGRKRWGLRAVFIPSRSNFIGEYFINLLRESKKGRGREEGARISRSFLPRCGFPPAVGDTCRRVVESVSPGGDKVALM